MYTCNCVCVLIIVFVMCWGSVPILRDHPLVLVNGVLTRGGYSSVDNIMYNRT